MKLLYITAVTLTLVSSGFNLNSEDYDNVVSSVNTINTVLNSIQYEPIIDIINDIQNPELIENKIAEYYFSRTLKIYNYTSDKLQIEFASEIDELLPMNALEHVISIQRLELFYGTDNIFLHSLYLIDDNLNGMGNIYDEQLGNFRTEEYINLYLGFLDESFIGTYAFNIDNNIYLSIKGETFLIQEMSENTTIVL